MNIQTILNKFRAMAPSKREQGYLFEKFIRQYLLRSKLYSEIETVWLWSEFPFRNGQGDTGIDLVAKTKSGDYWAIQCKCYAKGSQIDKASVDSFLSASSTAFNDETGTARTYAMRYIVSTVAVSRNAKLTLENQVNPVCEITTWEMDDSGIDWDKFWNDFDRRIIQNNEKDISHDVYRLPKELRDYQKKALKDVIKGFEHEDRGKLIMACGTGKTFVSLRIAEKMVPPRGVMLYLVPSLSLMAQTLRAWTVDTKRDLTPILVCSDTRVHEQDTRRARRLREEDIPEESITELSKPATTDAATLATYFNDINATSDKSMIVVFSTYQSLDVIRDAQQAGAIPEFDLVICDEAHRTTGVLTTDREATNFILIHDNDQIQAKKRLYMTATPRIYGAGARTRARERDSDVVSMDDFDTFGREFHHLSFGEAVEMDLLTDYKVVVLSVDETAVKRLGEWADSDLQLSTSEDGTFNISEASKLLGCWQGLIKNGTFTNPDNKTKSDFSFDPKPIKRAVAFCKTIYSSQKEMTPAFQEIAQMASKTESPDLPGSLLVDMKHVDGSYGANERKDLLDWLASEPEEGHCHVLSNVRCLSEGVDVPALDAVIFLSPRRSQVDVVQSVGRVMRKSPDKKFGYIILPVAIPEGADPNAILENNGPYEVVWEVLQALRSHDERFNIWINQIQFQESDDARKNPILIGDPLHVGNEDGDTETVTLEDDTGYLDFGDLVPAMRAKIVEKCGDRDYFDNWAREVAEIALSQVVQIRTALENPSTSQKRVFNRFLKMLKTDLNPSVDEAQAVEMLTQHIISKPVFDSLFKDNAFTRHNALSKAIQKVIDTFQTSYTEDQQKQLDHVKSKIRRKIEGIQSAEGKQRVITQLYDNFFKAAMPKTVDRLGIVYTPVEVVDFIINSVEAVLKKHFNRRLSNPSVHVLDPFTGTGTFIVRLLQSGLIDKKDFLGKVNETIHANEIVLLAYYIAAVNIENAIHDELVKFNDGNPVEYQSFPGLVLTDTFQLNETELTDAADEFDDEINTENNKRINRQKRQIIEVIIGNPPYSAVQRRANDNNQNQPYPKLDKRVAETYAANTDAKNKNRLYDSYINAFRWASDRIPNKGVVAFVTNAQWLRSNSADGLRQCFAEEFSDIYVFDCRGNQRTSGEQSRREGGKIFGSGSRTPIAITILVKDPPRNNPSTCNIHYHDIGDYLSQAEKLAILKKSESIENVEWKDITPNEQNDWLTQRSEEFAYFYPIGSRDDDEKNPSFWENRFSLGLATNRDVWVYNSSITHLNKNVKLTINYYNSLLKRVSSGEIIPDSEQNDSSKISWSRSLQKQFEAKKIITNHIPDSYESLYRPLFKTHLCPKPEIFETPSTFYHLFPSSKVSNMSICIPGLSSQRDFSTIMTDALPDRNLFEGGAQCFPLHFYTPVSKDNLFDLGECEEAPGFVRNDGISDAILEEARAKYPSIRIEKIDLFYYVYGILHSNDYRTKFAQDLKLMLARIPLVDKVQDFQKFRLYGECLGQLHLSYDSPDRLNKAIKKVNKLLKDANQPVSVANVQIVTRVTNPNNLPENELYRVLKMKFAGTRPNLDKTKIIYNPNIHITGIPLDAYNYVVNGKSALEWVMERYAVTTDRASGIVNDPNLFDESNPKYIVDLIQSVVTVSVNTNRLVEQLPKL